MGSYSTDSLRDILSDRYTILKKIGEGGFGAVYKARQKSTGQIVAIKRLVVQEAKIPDLAEEQERRFMREMELIGKLKNAYIVGLLDAGYSDGPWMVLEFIEGRELLELIQNDELSIRDTIRIISQVLEALSEAHEYGIVHRDLKPQNIMISKCGARKSAKVLDFGIAGVQESLQDSSHDNITRQGGQVYGTPAYMAIEQFSWFSEPCPETDVYAIGIILLECLTGKKVYKGSAQEIFHQKKGEKEITRIPSYLKNTAIASIIRRACTQDLDERYKSAELMLEAMDEISRNTEILDEITLALESKRIQRSKVAKKFKVAGSELQAIVVADTKQHQSEFKIADDTTLVSDQVLFLEPEAKRSYMPLFAIVLVILTAALIFGMMNLSKESESIKRREIQTSLGILVPSTGSNSGQPEREKVTKKVSLDKGLDSKPVDAQIEDSSIMDTNVLNIPVLVGHSKKTNNKTKRAIKHRKVKSGDRRKKRVGHKKASRRRRVPSVNPKKRIELAPRRFEKKKEKIDQKDLKSFKKQPKSKSPISDEEFKDF